MTGSNPKSDFVHVNGIHLHFLDWGGNGPALLFLTGMGSSAYIFNKFAPRFTDEFHVLALTRRGHGDSEWNREQDYSIDSMVGDAVAFIADQQLRDPIVFGHSMGGRISLTMATQHPGLARAFVIVDVGPEISPEGSKTIQHFVVNNIEFDDLEIFLDNVQKYDPFRTRAHIERIIL